MYLPFPERVSTESDLYQFLASMILNTIWIRGIWPCKGAGAASTSLITTLRRPGELSRAPQARPLLSLDCEPGLQDGFWINDLRKAMKGHVLEETCLIGLYG